MIRSTAQTLTESDDIKIRLLAWGCLIFLRLLALVVLALAVLVWARALGVWPDETARFDLLPAAGRTYTAVQAVLLPVAAVGLWTSLAWGRVVWLLSVAILLMEYATIPSTPDLYLQLLILNAIAIVTYFSMRLTLFFIANKD